MQAGLEVSPAEVLSAVTTTAADAIGLGDQLGSISPGKRADLVVLDDNPVNDLDHVRSVRAVFRDGVKLVERDRILVPSRAEAADPWTWIKDFS